MAKLKEICSLARSASHHYGRNFFVLLTLIIWRRLYGRHMLTEITLVDLLSPNPGPLKVARRASTRKVIVWLNRINPPQHRASVDVKPRFYQSCEQAGIPCPRVYATGYPTVEILETLPANFLVKPAFGAGGFGVSAFSRVDEGFREWTGKVYSPEDLIVHLTGTTSGRKLIFQDWLKPHPNLRQLSQSALMTVRAATLLQRDGDPAPQFLFSYLRVPAANSLTDNLHFGEAGQQWIELDTVTGQALRSWSRDPSGFGLRELDFCEGHPRVPLSEIQIPQWTQVKDILLKLSGTFPQLRSIGWDIGISEKGPVAIEGNTAWGVPLYPHALATVSKAMRKASTAPMTDTHSAASQP